MSAADYEPDDRSWVDTSALEAIALERNLRTETDEELSRRLLRESSPRAALSLIYLMDKSMNEKIRMDAAKYILDRSLGRIGEDIVQEDDPIMGILKSIVKVQK